MYQYAEDDAYSDEDYTYEDEEVYEEEEVEEIKMDDENVDFDVSFTLAIPATSLTAKSSESNIDALLRVSQNVLDEETSHGLDEMVWINDAKLAYQLCKVVERRGSILVVEYCDEFGEHVKKNVSISETQPKSVSHFCDDMCHLTELNEASVLHTIRSRYDQKLIHTYSGLFCVVVNPWREVPLYTPEIIDYYMNESKVDKNLPPHIYSIAQSAYNGILQGLLFDRSSRGAATTMSMTRKNSQSILITGESGAGKTENTKKIIEYLLCCATNSTKFISGCDSLTKIGTSQGLDSAILNAGIALEAFSNAKTVYNNNSSRLGKFIRLEFDDQAKLSTARIDCYLLEKSRVVNQNEGDRNFHIFYQIFTSGFCNEKKKRALGLLKNPDGYRFLNCGDCVTVRGIDDQLNAEITSKALDALGFREAEKTWVLQCVAACILTGEIRFNERHGLDMSYVENAKDVDCVANLLGLSASRLIDALTQPTIRVGDNIIRKNQNLKKTLLLTSAFVKVIYERLFTWIVDKCNAAIEVKSRNSGILNDASDDNFIGVLDMAGFEIMNQNSFEQFCINYTNEKLQQFFNQVLFVKERNDYISEGIEWNEENYGNDLQQTIDLIERPMGLLSLLQEECIVPNGKDTSLLEKLYQNLMNASSGGIFAKAKYSSRSKYVNHFTVLHYAGQVAYNIDGWVEKNRDLVDQGILDVLSKSTHMLIAQLFTAISKQQVDVMTRSRRGSFATSTISCIYKEQLNNLLQTLNSSKAHFIRCIVPNYQRQPFVLDGLLVMNQLKCNGVLEGIRVYRRGYPNRIFFGEFLRRYNLLYATQIVGGSTKTMFSECLAVENMCKSLKIDANNYRIGKTKIFCRTGLISELENRRKQRLSAIVVQFQARARWYLAQVDYRRRAAEINAARLLQDAIRQHVTLNDWPWHRLLMKVRGLIPLVRDRQRLAELETENDELKTENKRLKLEVDELREHRRASDEKSEKLAEERENATQKAMELRQELKRNEELLELMERKFDDQHTKIMRLNNSLNENVKLLERMEDEKRHLDAQYKSLTKRFADEINAKETAQCALKSAREECTRLQTRLDAMFTELKNQDEKIQLRDEELIELKEKFEREAAEIAELNRVIIDANERANKSETLLHEERNQRRKYESEMDDLEEENDRLRGETDRVNIKHDAMKEQLRAKDNSIRKLEHKLDDKCVEMESCISELKKMHKATQHETQNQLDELKRKCMKLEMENKQQKMIIESNAASNNIMTMSSSTFDRESSIDSDYSRASTLGRHQHHHYSSRYHNMFGGSSTSIHSSSGGGGAYGGGTSIRALSARRRDTEPELFYGSGSARYYDMTTSSYGSLGRSLSSSSTRLSRNGTLNNLAASVTSTFDSGLARSSSSSSNAPPLSTTTSAASNNAQLQSSERKVAQLERDLQNTRTDGHLMKREVEVYKDSLQESEKEKDRLEKQVHALSAEVDQLTRSLKVEEDRNQQMNFNARKASNECEAWKKRVENAIQDSHNELQAERKKHLEKLEEQKHEYELKFNHVANSQKNFVKLQSDLADAQTQLDKALGQIAQMERIQKSQDVIGVTWEAQYRGAVQEIESLRDENAALKSKIRRQYKQIELLTQQTEINEYVSDLESKVGRFSDRVEKSASVVEIPIQITGQAHYVANGNN